MEAKRSPDSAEKNDPREDGGPTLVFEKEGHIVFETPASSLAKHPITIGRDKECDWCTAGIDGSISSRHAEIYRRHGAVRIRDLGSRNGIFAKGERVKECRVTIGDPILIGACKLSLEPPRKAGGSLKSEHHRLEQLNGPNAGRVLEIVEEKDIVIGSDPASGIFIADTLVSRKHAKLSFKKNECWLSDLGSRNGTSVNGVAVTKERLLRDGDVISVAYVEFRFYDKDVAHVDAHVGKTLFIAAATVGFGMLGYSFWNLMRPEAGRLLYKAETAASSWTPKSQPEDFARAFAYLDEAAVARAADKHATALAEQKSRMESWTNTIAGWQDVQKLLQEKKWVSARKKFHSLVSWTWPSQTAAQAHHEADSVQVLVNAFLDCRSDIRSEEFQPNAIVARFKNDADALEKALSEAPSEERKYIMPLRGETEDLLGEFRHALEVLDSIPAVAESLRTSGRQPPAPDAATMALARLKAILDDEKRHEQERQAEALKRELPQPYFSPLVSVRIAAALAPLEALASGERQIAANVDAIAATDWNAVKRNLVFPERSVTDVDSAYQHYRDWLIAKNAQFCGTDQNPFAGVDSVFKTALKSLEGRGFGSDVSGMPPSLALLLRKDTIAAVLRFVDPDKDPMPDASDSSPVCAYDRFVGLKAFAEFLEVLSEASQSVNAGDMVDYGTIQSAVNNYASATDRLPWRPLVAEARRLQGHLRSFLKRPDEVVSMHPDSMYSGPILATPARIIVDARPKKGRNRCAEALSNASIIMREIDDWKNEDLQDAIESDGSSRASILADGVALIMADPRELAAPAMRRRATEVGARVRKLKRELKEIERKAEAEEPLAVRREIVSKGIPAMSPPFVGAWRYLRKQSEVAE